MRVSARIEPQTYILVHQGACNVNCIELDCVVCLTKTISSTVGN